jgi:hypothetical protein
MKSKLKSGQGSQKEARYPDGTGGLTVGHKNSNSNNTTERTKSRINSMALEKAVSVGLGKKYGTGSTGVVDR